MKSTKLSDKKAIVRKQNSTLPNKVFEQIRSTLLKESQKKKPKSEFYILAGNQKIEIPLEKVAKMIDILEQKPMPDDNVLSTQEVADLLNVSRPYVVKLIEEQKIAAFKVGPQRRVLAKDAFAFKNKMRAEQIAALEELSAESEKLGLDF
jgi:excisionase family DNA binding protein